MDETGQALEVWEAALNARLNEIEHRLRELEKDLVAHSKQLSAIQERLSQEMAKTQPHVQIYGS